MSMERPLVSRNEYFSRKKNFFSGIIDILSRKNDVLFKEMSQKPELIIITTITISCSVNLKRSFPYSNCGNEILPCAICISY